MSDQAEVTFTKAFVNNLSQQPLNYPDDFQQPLENNLKRMPTLQVRTRLFTMLCKDLHERCY